MTQCRTEGRAAITPSARSIPKTASESGILTIATVYPRSGDRLRDGRVGPVVHVTAGVENETGDGGTCGRGEDDELSLVLDGDVRVRLHRGQGLVGGAEGGEPPGDEDDDAEQNGDADDGQSNLQALLHVSPGRSSSAGR